MKKQRQLFILLGLVLLLAGGYLLQTNKKTQNKEQIEEASPKEQSPKSQRIPLIQIDKENLKTLSINNESGSIILINGKDKLTLQNHPQWILDTSHLKSFLYSLLNISSSTLIEESASDKDTYGLQNPKAKVVYLTSKGEEGLLLGDRTPSGSGYYAQKEGENSVYLISSYGATSLLIGASDLRDRRLPPVNLQEIKSLSLSGKNPIEIVPYFQYEKFSSSLSPFLMLKPYKRPVAVNAEALTKLVQKLQDNFKIIDFAPDGITEEELGLNSGQILTIRNKQDQSITLSIGKEDPKGNYYVKLKDFPTLFTLSSEALGIISERPFNLSDHFVRLIGITDVATLKISTPQKNWVGTIKKIDEEKSNYTFQGEEIAEDPFKEMYQEVLYLLTEGEVDKPVDTTQEAVMTIEYIGNPNIKGSTTARFFPYNDEYYGVEIDGFTPEFIIGHYQIDQLKEYLIQFDQKH